LRTVGEVVHTLPEGELVVGVTSLADEVYVLREKERDQVEVYDVINYRLQRRLTVPNCRRFSDMTSCGHYRCLYIADDVHDRCIHRLEVQGATAYTKWAVNDVPFGLSVNSVHNVLVTCRDVSKIKEFSSHGNLLRELTLPDDVINPRHAIQLTNGQLIVCHGRLDNAVHCVCKITTDVVQSHGGQSGSNISQYQGPISLAVDNNDFVFVAEEFNRRVTLLSPTLDRVRQVASPDKLKWYPCITCLDSHRRRLYVAENKFILEAGRVIVFSV